MTVIPTSSEHDYSTKQELSYQPKLHQLMCYCVKRRSKTLTSIYPMNAGSCWAGCTALAAEMNCYLHSQDRQDAAREAGGHVRKLLYIVCTSRTILLRAGPYKW